MTPEKTKKSNAKCRSSEKALMVEVIITPVPDAQTHIVHAFDLILRAAARAPKS